MRWPYRAGIAAALLASLMSLWTMVVRDDGTGIGYMMVILAAGARSFAAWFEPLGIARSTLGVAAMQVLLAIGIATAPVTALVPGAVIRTMVAGGVLALLWLASAAILRAACQADLG